MLELCLKWDKHMNNMKDVFKSLLSTESMADVTLACEGFSLKAHKIVLSSGSPFFKSLFLENPCKHPIVILTDMKFSDLKAVVEFMYFGEVNVAQEKLPDLMKTAEILRVKGLVDVTEKKSSLSSDSSEEELEHKSDVRTDTPPPRKQRRRGHKRKLSLNSSSCNDENSNELNIKQPISSEIEELVGNVTLSDTNSEFTNMQSQVPLQSMPSCSDDTFHKSTSVLTGDFQIDEQTSADKSEFGVVTEELNTCKHSNVETKKTLQSNIDHGSVESATSMPLDTSNQQPNDLLSLKAKLLELDATSSSSHSNDATVYKDQSSTFQLGHDSSQATTDLVSENNQKQTYPVQLMIKPHKCSKCSFVASEKIDLSRHLCCTHERERPFICSICSKDFVRKDHLKRHLNRVHSSTLK